MMHARMAVPPMIAAVVVASALASACFSERAHDTTGPSGECTIPLDSPVIGATGALVAIRGFGFHPAVVRVRPGTTVTWINCEPAGIDAHTSTSDAAVWASPFLAPGATYSHTFGAAGSYDYHCLPHAFMRGSVVVE